MDNHTVMKLKAIAKERGKRVYYKLRKAELIHALEAERFVEQSSNIFDESVPNDSSPVLQSLEAIKYRLENKQNMKNFITNSMQKIKDFGEWLLNYIRPKQKVVDTVLESFKNKIKKIYEKSDTLFQPLQSKSALKNFAIQYQIKGLNGYDPE